MKLTVTLTGQKRRYRRSFSIRTVVSMTVLSSLFVLVSSRTTDSVMEDFGRVKVAQGELNASKAEVDALATNTKTQLEELMLQIAQLEAQMYQLEQKNQNIAVNIGMKSTDLDEFVADSDVSAIENDSLLQRINAFKSSLDEKSTQLNVLESIVKGHHIDNQSQISGRPVNSGWLSSYYGMRADPFSGKPAMHKGIDFAGKTGDDVVSTGAGIVTWAGDRYGYGLLVEINHGNGLVSRYGHNQSLEVSIGDVVTKGEVVAIMGSTGRSTGAHVHYEVLKNGKQIDPLPFVYKSTSR